MKFLSKVLVLAVLCAGVVFAKEKRNNIRTVVKKVKADHSWVKDQAKNNEDNQLERKRSHKRRRKIRKPIKGLR